MQIMQHRLRVLALLAALFFNATPCFGATRADTEVTTNHQIDSLIAALNHNSSLLTAQRPSQNFLSKTVSFVNTYTPIVLLLVDRIIPTGLYYYRKTQNPSEPSEEITTQITLSRLRDSRTHIVAAFQESLEDDKMIDHELAQKNALLKTVTDKQQQAEIARSIESLNKAKNQNAKDRIPLLKAERDNADKSRNLRSNFARILSQQAA